MTLRQRIYYLTYSTIMKLAHRYGWHYAPGFPEPLPQHHSPEAGAKMHWCHWCGLRGFTFNPTGPLRVKDPNQ